MAKYYLYSLMIAFKTRLSNQDCCCDNWLPSIINCTVWWDLSTALSRACSTRTEHNSCVLFNIFFTAVESLIHLVERALFAALHLYNVNIVSASHWALSCHTNFNDSYKWTCDLLMWWGVRAGSANNTLSIQLSFENSIEQKVYEIQSDIRVFLNILAWKHELRRVAHV